MATTKSQMAAALQLQQRRCAMFHLWESRFRSVLSGALSVSELDHIMHTVVVKEFQDVSVALRTLHNEVAAGQQAVVEKEVAAGTASDAANYARLLLKWIDDLQDVEREHYQATVTLLASVASHAAPNVDGKVVVKAGDAAEDETGSQQEQQAEGEEGEEKREAAGRSNPSASEEEKDGNENDQTSHSPGRGCAAEAAANGRIASGVDGGHDNKGGDSSGAAGGEGETPAPPPPPVRYSVHDRGACALCQLFPPSALTTTRFVDCAAVIDCLGGDGDDDDDGSSSAAPELQPLTTSAEAFRSAKTAVEREACVLAHYDPAAVLSSCRVWSAEVRALHRRKKALEQRALDLVDDLQCELSDLLVE